MGRDFFDKQKKRINMTKRSMTIEYFKVAKINDLKIEYSDDWGGH